MLLSGEGGKSFYRKSAKQNIFESFSFMNPSSDPQLEALVLNILFWKGWIFVIMGLFRPNSGYKTVNKRHCFSV